jgi:hypothetical protein
VSCKFKPSRQGEDVRGRENRCDHLTKKIECFASFCVRIFTSKFKNTLRNIIYYWNRSNECLLQIKVPKRFLNVQGSAKIKCQKQEANFFSFHLLHNFATSYLQRTLIEKIISQDFFVKGKMC